MAFMEHASSSPLTRGIAELMPDAYMAFHFPNVSRQSSGGQIQVCIVGYNPHIHPRLQGYPKPFLKRGKREGWGGGGGVVGILIVGYKPHIHEWKGIQWA